MLKRPQHRHNRVSAFKIQLDLVDRRTVVNGGEKPWRLAGEKCSALPEGITRWSVAGRSLRDAFKSGLHCSRSPITAASSADGWRDRQRSYRVVTTVIGSEFCSSSRSITPHSAIMPVVDSPFSLRRIGACRVLSKDFGGDQTKPL